MKGMACFCFLFSRVCAARYFFRKVLGALLLKCMFVIRNELILKGETIGAANNHSSKSTQWLTGLEVQLTFQT